MNKRELIATVAQEAELTNAAAERAVNAFVSAVAGALAGGDDVALAGFGSFRVRERAARTGRNPRTGQVLRIPPGKAPAFKPGKTLKDMVNGAAPR
jgi:DNA-binding protein HU-beta